MPPICSIFSTLDKKKGIEGQSASFQLEAARFLDFLLGKAFKHHKWSDFDKVLFVERLERTIYGFIDDFTNINRDVWLRVYCALWLSIEHVRELTSEILKSRINFVFNEAMCYCSKDEPDISKRLGVQLLSSVVNVSLSAGEPGAGDFPVRQAVHFV
jgi:hypothetical protein